MSATFSKDAMTKEEARNLPPEIARARFDELARRIVRAQDAGEMTNEEIAHEFDCTLDFVHHARSRDNKRLRLKKGKYERVTADSGA